MLIIAAILRNSFKKYVFNKYTNLHIYLCMIHNGVGSEIVRVLTPKNTPQAFYKPVKSIDRNQRG